MSLGLIIIFIVFFGYISNWLNWRYLNYKLTRYLYYIGAAVHESSHALLCLVTGAKISEFKIFSSQPHVTHSRSKLPIVGNVLISSAPIFGGLAFLFLINHFLLGNYFTISTTSTDLYSSFIESFKLITQLNPLHWQSWVLVILFINVGAMLGPSFQDIKNMWPALIILLFIQLPVLNSLCLIALGLIFINIIIQVILILVLKVVGYFV